MITITVFPVIFYVILTSQALPAIYYPTSVETNLFDLDDVPVEYHKPLKTILSGIAQLREVERLNMQKAYAANQVVSTTMPTTTTTSSFRPFSKRSHLSINQELKSLADLLVLRENKRRRAEMSEMRSRLMAIGKRSVSRARIQKRDAEFPIFHKDGVVTDKDVVMFLTKLFPKISEPKMEFIMAEYLGNYGSGMEALLDTESLKDYLY